MILAPWSHLPGLEAPFHNADVVAVPELGDGLGCVVGAFSIPAHWEVRVKAGSIEVNAGQRNVLGVRNVLPS